MMRLGIHKNSTCTELMIYDIAYRPSKHLQTLIRSTKIVTQAVTQVLRFIAELYEV